MLIGDYRISVATSLASYSMRRRVIKIGTASPSEVFASRVHSGGVSDIVSADGEDDWWEAIGLPEYAPLRIPLHKRSK